VEELDGVQLCMSLAENPSHSLLFVRVLDQETDPLDP
jgi:hypothetical protein